MQFLRYLLFIIHLLKMVTKFLWLLIPLILILFGVSWWVVIPTACILLGVQWWLGFSTVEERDMAKARKRALGMFQLTASMEDIEIHEQKMREAKTPEEREALTHQFSRQVLAQADFPTSKKEMSLMCQQMTNMATKFGNRSREKDTLKVVKAGQYDRQEERPLAEILRLLDEAMAKVDKRVPQLFNPGLTLEEIQDLIQKETKLNHPDLITLYTWHNGFRSFKSAELFNDYNFMPVEEALRYYDGEMAAFGQKHLFTIMNNSFGSTLDLDLRNKKPYNSLVSLADAELGVMGVYPGLNAFFGALLAAFQEGVFQVEIGTGTNGEDMVVSSYNHIYKIWTAYQFQDPEEENSQYDDDDDDDDDSDSDDYDDDSSGDDDDTIFKVSLPPAQN